jgi:hypothetical protein
MNNRKLMAGTALASVALWVVGLVLAQGATTSLADDATDAQVLAWVQGNEMKIIVGGWLFTSGCVIFVWFAALLRERLGDSPAATLVYTGAAMMAVFGTVTQSDLGSAIDKDNISPATAGALHHLGDVGFLGIELTLVLVFGAIAVLAFSADALPRWWGVVSAILGIVAFIGPIGWAVVIFGLPLWTLVTPWLVGRGARRRAAAPSAATA